MFLVLWTKCVSYLFGQWQSVLQVFMKMMGQSCPTSEAFGTLYGTLYAVVVCTLYAACLVPCCTLLHPVAPCLVAEPDGTLFGG
jgi:hypothetical protein